LQNNLRLCKNFLEITNQDFMQENWKYTKPCIYHIFWAVYATSRRQIDVFEFSVFVKITTCSAGNHRRSIAK
jgi:hypothetical protein